MPCPRSERCPRWCWPSRTGATADESPPVIASPAKPTVSGSGRAGSDRPLGACPRVAVVVGSMRLAKVTIPHSMEATPEDPTQPTGIVVIEPGRAPADVVLGAVDAALRSDFPGLAVWFDLSPDDPRSDSLQALCGSDARVVDRSRGAIGADRRSRCRPVPAPSPGPWPRSRRSSMRGERGSVEVAMPGRWRRPRCARRTRQAPRPGKRAPVPGRLRPADRRPALHRFARRAGPARRRATSRTSAPSTCATARARRRCAPVWTATLTASRASGCRPATNAPACASPSSVSGATGAGEWVRWRSRNVGRRAAGLPAAAASATRSARSSSAVPGATRSTASAPASSRTDARAHHYGSIAVSSKRRPRHSRWDWIRK